MIQWMREGKNYPDLRQVAQHYCEQLMQVKAFVVDVDGVMTNGQVYYAGKELGYNRHFHVCDGYALKILAKAGIKVGVISGGDSLGLKMRLADLGLMDCSFLGNEDKRQSYLNFKAQAGVEDQQVLYMGDDLFDIPILKRVGLAVTVPHASEEVKDVANYITFRGGGEGSVREVADMLRYVQNIYPEIPDFDDV